VSLFEPKLQALPAAQRRVWPELAEVPKSFVLYGGRALSLRLAHRESVDFDLFSSDRLDRRSLARLPFARGAQVLQDERDAWTISVERKGPVKIFFFGKPDDAAGVLAVASLLDLAATKLKVLLQRVELKDYLDVAALLRAGVPLKDMLRAACSLYGPAFNPLVAQKTLGFFEGAELGTLDARSRELLSRASLEDVDLAPMPRASDRLD
jgi:hypothetical protein